MPVARKVFANVRPNAGGLGPTLDRIKSAALTRAKVNEVMTGQISYVSPRPVRLGKGV